MVHDHSFSFNAKSFFISDFQTLNHAKAPAGLETRSGRALAPAEMTGKGSGGFRTRLTDGAHAQM